jgi:hypothetical protein
VHPRIHIPAWAAVAVVAAAYVVRSALRGWDFAPDLPWDLVVALTLVALLVARSVLRRQGWDEPPRGAEREPDGPDRDEEDSR